MVELVAFLRARIDEEFALTHAIPDDADGDIWITSTSPAHLGIGSGRLRVELEAKRRLVDWGEQHGERFVLEQLAMPYDGHPDWACVAV